MKNIFDSKEVLITGGLGFIGSNLAISLVEMGASVTLVDSLVSEYGGNLFNIDGIKEKVDVNICDVRDQQSINHLVKRKHFVFNLAGQTSHMDSMLDPYTDLDINAKAQLHILEACRKNNPTTKIVFASTRQLYGKVHYLPVDESHPINPVDVNGINKLAGEMYHRLYYEVYGIRSCSLRLTNTYGPRMRICDARQTFLGIWIKELLDGMPIEVWGGMQIRDFNYVDDCVSALLKAASEDITDGRVYNLGSRETINLRKLAELLIDINESGSMAIKEFPDERKKIDIGDYYSDPTLFETELDWTASVNLRQGLKRTLDYYRKFRDQYLLI